VIDLMKDNGVQLLINTPSGPVARVDEIKIRSEAILRGLPIVTTESGARATVRAIRYIAQNEWNVKPIQEYHI
jgi:carbamoyl-phosphate synthase large subunit